MVWEGNEERGQTSDMGGLTCLALHFSKAAMILPSLLTQGTSVQRPASKRSAQSERTVLDGRESVHRHFV